MKRILLLSLLLLPIVALAQYPTFSNKQKLGVQTTGDGLIFRGTTINNIPNYAPSNVNNAYFHLDTTNSKLYLYNATAWQLVYPSPQFDTTTLNVYLKISDTTAMLLPYFRDSDTTSLNLISRFALKLNISDTATMLTPYLRKADTISLSNRINLKLNISDTTILSNRITTNANNIIIINNKLNTKLDTIYKKLKNVVTRVLNKDTLDLGGSLTEGYGINIIGDSINADTNIIFIKSDTITLSNRIDNKLSLIDTASMLLPYLKLADTTSMLAPYFRDSDTTMLNLTTRFNSKLNTTDTVSLSDRINLKLNPIDTISLSNRIDIKLNASDTVSLSNRINKKLDTLYVNYQTSIDTIVNKDTINITTLEAGAGINITNNVISLDTTLLDSVVRVQNVYVKNGTGTVLNKGEAVYVTGANGTNIIVGRASNVAESSSSKTLGLTMTSIAIDGFGYVVKEGLLAGLNTNSADSAGVPIWLGVNGALIYGLNNKPYAPNHLVYLGVVTRKQQNNGEVYVTVQNGFEIKELHDVQILSPVNKASLYYNLSESLWRDTTAALLVSDTASMLNPYLRKLDTITLSNRINLKFNTADTAILGYVTTYSNQYNINGNKTFNNTVSVDSLNATKQAKIQSLTVGKGGYAIIGGITGGISSTAFGFEALKNNTLGDWNTAIGYQALLNNDTAWNNVAIGNNALKFNTGGEYNTAIGVDALDLNIVGNYNTAIGYSAGNGSKGNNNIFIGSNTSHSDSINNTLMIGGINAPLLSGILSGNKKLGINVNPLNITNTFEVYSPISDAVKINSNTNSTNLELMNSGGSVYIKSSNKNMTLQTDTTALVYLKGDVNRVGILTMNPQQALEVAGTIRVDSLDNNLTPVKLVGGSNSNDLTNVELGTGLSFVNDTLKIADNIINSGDTATLLRKDYISINSNVLVWTEGNKKLLPYFTQIYRNGQLLKYENQYTITSDSIVTLAVGSFRLKDNITIIAIDNITALAGSGGVISLSGNVSGSGTNSINTTINNGVVTNSMLAGSISNDKLDVITATNKVSNSATTATNNNTINTIVSRDGSGNFSAGTITASLNGNALTSTTATIANGVQSFLTTGIIKLTTPSNAVQPTITVPDVNATIATTNLSQTFGGTQTFSNTINGSINGNAATVTTNANLTGDVTSTGNTTSIATGVIVNADINASAAIAVSKLASSTISGVTLGSNLNTLTISTPLTGTSYNGSSAVSIGIQAATTSVAGSMSAADKSKLDGIASGATANTGTVTSVNGTGTVSGLTLTGTVSSTGNLTLGGTLSLTSGNVTTALGYTPYNSTNPNGYITSSALSPYATLASPTFTGTVVLPSTTSIGTVDNTEIGFVNGVTSAIQTQLNAKQNTLTNPVTGTGTNNYIPKFTTTGSTIGNSTLIDNGTTISTSSILSTTNYAALDAGNNTHRLTNTLSGNQTWNTPYGFITSYSGNWYFNIDIDGSTSTDFPILSVLSNSITKKSGIALNSQLTANGTYTPAITFSSLSNSGAYYSTYAAIIGKKTGTGGQFGDSGNYNSGHIEFYGTAQVGQALGGVMLTPPNMVVGVGVGIGYDAPPTIKGRLIVSEKIGINQSTPNFALDVNGTANITGATTLGSTLTVTGATTLNNILTINSGANTNSLSINNTGASNILSMYSTNNNSFTRSEYKNGSTGSTTNDGLNVGYFDGGYFVNYENTKSYLYTNNNTNQLVLDTDGNVGVGIADATDKLDVNGTLRVRTTNTIAPTSILGKDNNGVVGGIVVGNGLTLSGSTLSLSASSGGFITTNNNYTVTITDTWIVFNNNFNNIIVTLPDATTSLGRTLYFRNVAAGSIVSAGTANIIDNTITTGTPNNNILGAGNTNVKWCTLVSNGQYWIKMQAGSL